nr:substrate-binding domain-containing protein [Candidatus Delongbacteria bacterium]
FFPFIIRSIDLTDRDYGYQIILCDSNEDVELGIESFELLLSRQVDGIILLGEILPPKKLEYYLARHPLPMVAVECDYGFSQVHTIITDNQQGGYMATQHLLSLGYRSIGMISDYLTTRPGRQRLYGSNERLMGYRAALKEYGVEFNPHWIREGEHNVEGGRIAMTQFFESGTVPKAIFATNDMMAIGAMEVVREKGLTVPADLALVGYDNIPQASFTSPKLTTIALPKKKIGAKAVELLAQQLISGQTQCQKIMMPIRILVRESCGSAMIKE